MSARCALWVLFVVVASGCAVKVRKCCNKGESLNKASACSNETDLAPSDWLPLKSFIIHSSKSTVSVSREKIKQAVKEIYSSNVEVGFPSCDASWRDLAIAWKDPGIEDQFFLSYDSEKNVKLNLNRDSVYHNKTKPSFSKAISSESYCIDSADEESYVAIVCPCTEITCVRKCCFQNMVFDEDTNKCVYVDALNMTDEQFQDYREWRPKFESTSGDEEDDEVEYFLLSRKLPTCHKRGTYTEYLEGEDPISFLPDGRVRSRSGLVEVPAGEHCGEWGWRASRGALSPLVVRCFSVSAEDEHVRGMQRAVGYALLSLLAALLLALAAVAISLDGELAERRGARPQLMHVASLAVAHAATAVTWSMSADFSQALCVIAGYLMQFSFLAAFFWLNAMCVDMSWTFSGVRPPGGSPGERDRRKFRWYSLYAWGGSVALTSIAIMVDFVPGVPPTSPFKPNFGVVKCWFNTSQSLLLYFYGPMGLLLLANLSLFLYTSWRIIVLSRGTGALHQEDSARHHGSNTAPSNKDRQRFLLYAKLFSLMGVTWVTEIISWAVGGSNYFWYFTDIINILRAVFIFVIFCWKPKIWMGVKKKAASMGLCKGLVSGRHTPGSGIRSRSTNSSNKNSTTKTDFIEMDPKT